MLFQTVRIRKLLLAMHCPTQLPVTPKNLDQTQDSEHVFLSTLITKTSRSNNMPSHTLSLHASHTCISFIDCISFTNRIPSSRESGKCCLSLYDLCNTCKKIKMCHGLKYHIQHAMLWHICLLYPLQRYASSVHSLIHLFNHQPVSLSTSTYWIIC